MALDKSAFLTATCACLLAGEAWAANPGHMECEKQLKRLSHGRVIEVPETKDFGNSSEYYFVWNAGNGTAMLKTKSGPRAGSCLLDRNTGKGVITLESKELGNFTTKRGL